MHSVLSRANAIFAYFTFILGGVVCLNVLSTFILPPSNPEITVQLNKVLGV
jgi:hypothetical protein